MVKLEHIICCCLFVLSAVGGHFRQLSQVPSSSPLPPLAASSKTLCTVTSIEIWETSMDQSRWRTESETCLCGRSFSHTSALSHHIRSCQKTKKRLSGALDKAKEVWSGKKRRRLDHEEPSMVNQPSSSGLVNAPHPVTPMENVAAVMYSFVNV